MAAKSIEARVRDNAAARQRLDAQLEELRTKRRELTVEAVELDEALRQEKAERRRSSAAGQDSVAEGGVAEAGGQAGE